MGNDYFAACVVFAVLALLFAVLHLRACHREKAWRKIADHWEHHAGQWRAMAILNGTTCVHGKSLEACEDCLCQLDIQA